MGSGLCWENCRGTCLSVPGCLKCVNRLGLAAIGRRNLHCRVCRRKEGMGWDGWISRKGACSWPDKAEHQWGYSKCTPCRLDMQSEFGIFVLSCSCKRKVLQKQIGRTICLRSTENGTAILLMQSFQCHTMPTLTVDIWTRSNRVNSLQLIILQSHMENKLAAPNVISGGAFLNHPATLVIQRARTDEFSHMDHHRLTQPYQFLSH